MSASSTIAPLTRWRLVLGAAAQAVCHRAGGDLDARALAMDEALDWLYGRESDQRECHALRQGGRGASKLSTPDWINQIHCLFPKETIERLEHDALERYAIEDLVTNVEVLARAEANETLLKAVLRTRHLMAPEVLVLARTLVRKVVERLMRTLAQELDLAFSGVLDRRRHTRQRVSRDLDFRRVLKDNLRRYDPVTRRLTVERLHFFARNRRRLRPWQVILLVDQSGSMAGSVIHAAVTAACLWGLPGIRTHLVAFDTAVVDLTTDVEDPVELLMKVQLGGGTDIQAAVGYAAGLIDQPARAIVVLISDFCEGSDPALLVQRVHALVGQGTLVLGLAALDVNADPAFDRHMAGKLAEAGAQVGAMTPGELAGWLAGKIRG